MRYFVISIQRQGEVTPCSIAAFDTRDAAASNYHSILASNYISETLDGFCVMLINEHGGTEMREYWEKQVPVDPESNDI